MANSVFLDQEGGASNKTIYMNVHNTTGKNFEQQPQLTSALIAKGYTVKSSATSAHYILQVNVLKLGQTSQTAAKEMMQSGYGGTMEGVATGVAVASTTGHNEVAGGLLFGVTSTIADNAVKDITMTGVTDVKITEHLSNGHVKSYTTRIGMTAEKSI